MKYLVFRDEESEPKPKRGPIVGREGVDWERLKFKQLLYGDKVLWVIIAILAIISVLVVFSSTAKMAYDVGHTASSWWYLLMQLGFLGGSLFLLLLLHRYSVRGYGNYSVWILLICLGLTGLTYVVGSTTNGAARWLPLGPIRLQPSEMLKVGLVLYLSKVLSLRQANIKKIRLLPFGRKLTKAKRKDIFWGATVPIVAPIFISVAVILFAHTSSAVLLFIVSIVVLAVAGIQRKEIAKVILLAVSCAAIYTIIGMGRSDTAGGRFSTWRDTWFDDRTEVRVTDISDTERSMAAIHNGGLLGQGAGQSVMRVEMIHPESDYAFAFFVEEYGLILSVLLLLLYLWVFFRAMWIYERSQEPFQQLLVINLALLIVVQALLHVMVAVNFLPETGQNLPLVSRGGSAMICTYLAFMMMLSVSMSNDEQAQRKTAPGARRSPMRQNVH